MLKIIHLMLKKFIFHTLTLFVQSVFQKIITNRAITILVSVSKKHLSPIECSFRANIADEDVKKLIFENSYENQAHFSMKSSICFLCY